MLLMHQNWSYLQMIQIYFSYLMNTINFELSELTE